MKKLLIVTAFALLPAVASAQYAPYWGWGWWAEPQGQVGQAGPLNWSYASNRATLNWLYGGGMFAGSGQTTSPPPYYGPYRHDIYDSPEQYVQPERITNPFFHPAGGMNSRPAPPNLEPAPAP